MTVSGCSGVTSAILRPWRLDSQLHILNDFTVSHEWTSLRQNPDSTSLDLRGFGV